MTTMIARPPSLTSGQRRLVLGLCALIPAELVALGLLCPDTSQLRLLYTAAIMDIALGAGGVMLYLSREHGRGLHRGIRWSSVARGVILGLALLGLAARLVGVPTGGVFLLPLVLMELIVGLIVTHGLVTSFRTSDDEETTLWQRIEETAHAQLPPTLAHAALGEARLLEAAARTLMRRPLREPDPSVLTSTRDSSYGALLAGLMLAGVGEMIAVHALLAHLLDSGQELAHGVIGALHVYGFAWLLGDWRLLRESGHRATETHLHIELGLRWSGSIPWSSITSIELGEVEVRDLLADTPRNPEVLAITPLETPNATLTLREPITLRTYSGLERRAHTVQLHLDQPERLRQLAPKELW